MDKLNHERKLNRRMMKMMIAMQKGLTERDEELKKLMNIVKKVSNK
jgi:hypothetical protein